MSAILKLYNYTKIPGAALNLENRRATVLLTPPGVCFITSLVLYDNLIIDFKSTDAAVSGGVTLTFDIPEQYDDNRISVFSFTHPDGYSNRLLGVRYSGIWFDHIGEILSFHAPVVLHGAQLLSVPYSGVDLGLRFNYIGNSFAGIGEIV